MGFYEALAAFYDDIFPVQEAKVAFAAGLLPAKGTAALLDAGCANGAFAMAMSRHLAERGDEVSIIGIDLDETMIGMARKAQDAGGYGSLAFEAIDMLLLEERFPEGSFDMVTCFGNTLVHLTREQAGRFLASAGKLLKPQGSLVMQILNYDLVYGRTITELPLIDNSRIRFERRYQLESRRSLTFSVRLEDKAQGSLYEASQTLYPLFKADVEQLLQEAGFAYVQFYSGYGQDGAWDPEKLPLVIEARKKDW